MADTHVAAQPQHVFVLGENIADQAVVLVQVQAVAFVGHDAGGILTAMLQHRKSVVDFLVDRGFGDDADDTAHKPISLPPQRRWMIQSKNSSAARASAAESSCAPWRPAAAAVESAPIRSTSAVHGSSPRHPPA